MTDSIEPPMAKILALRCVLAIANSSRNGLSNLDTLRPLEIRHV